MPSRKRVTTTYVKPGAYSTVRTRPGTVALPGGARILAIIGMGAREEILVANAVGTEVTLTVSTKPVETNMHTVFINGVETSAYTMTESTGVIILTSPLSLGDQLVVKYAAEADYNTPELFFDPADLYAKHGYPSFTNTLALGAQMAFENGAPAILAVQADPSDSDFSLSYAALEKETCTFVVPLPVIDFAAVFAAGQAHVQDMSTTKNKKERMLLCGGVEGIVPNNLIGASSLQEEEFFYPDIFIGGQTGIVGLASFVGEINQTSDPTDVLATSPARGYGTAGQVPYMDAYGNTYYADGYGIIVKSGEDWSIANFFDSFRVVFFFPDQIYRSINNVATALHGFYLAACAGGYLANQGQIAQPLTRKTLVGFYIDQSRKYTETQMDAMAAVGVTVVEALAAGDRVRHGLTTTQSGIPEQQEISVIQISDYVAYVTRTRLENQYVGGVIDNSTIPSMSATLQGILATLSSMGVITAYANVSVKQDRTLPTQIDIQFDVQPVYPLNFIRIDFSIGLI